MPGHRTARIAMFGLLYFAQGSIMSYFTALNAIYLLSYDLSMTQVGQVAGIAMLPFVLKIFLGMLSDRVNLFGLGHRKPYIIAGLFIQAACLLLVTAVNPGQQFGLFAATAFVLMSGMALYDTCTDGLALDTTPLSEQGTLQGVMVGGRALGVVVISGVLGIIAQQFSWTAAFLTLAGITLLPVPLVLRVRETPRPAALKFEWSAFSALTKAPIIALATLGAVYSLVINAASEIINPFMQAEFNISLANAGFYTMAWGVGTVAGGLAGGWLTDRLGQYRAVISALLLSLAAIFTLSLIFSPLAAWPLIILFGLAYGYYETIYFAISMNATNPRIAASMFSILMAIANIGTGVGLALSGLLVDSIGYRWTFTALAVFNLLAVPLLSLIFSRRAALQPRLAE